MIQYHIDVFLEKVAQEGNLSKEDLVKLSAIMKHAEYFARFSSSEFEEREQEKTYDLLLDDQMHNGVIIEVMSNKLLHYYENNERLYKNALILMEKVAESAREVAEPAEKVAEPAEKVAEPAEKVAEPAEKVAESAQKVADLSKMEDEAMSKRHKEILLLMEMGVEYSADEIAVSIGLKGSRTRKLLKELISMKKIKVTAATKNRRYIKM